MLVALAQLDMGYKTIELAKIKAEKMVREASEKQAQVIIFPEMTLTGFTMNQIADDSIALFFYQLSIDYSITIIYGAIEEGYYNYLEIIQDGKVLSHYRKIHPFQQESKYYQKGETIVQAKIDDLIFVPTICYDLRFPVLYYLCAKEADVLVNIASWPESRDDHWLTLLRARAIENQCYVIGVNRCGDDPGNHYIGHSAAFDGWGNQLNELKEEETVIYVEIAKKNYPVNFVKDQRDDLYLKLMEENNEYTDFWDQEKL